MTTPEDIFAHDCCIKCVHWYAEFCFRYPPVPAWNKASRKDYFAKYPAVAPGNWCGEYKPSTQQETLQDRINWIEKRRANNATGTKETNK